MKRIVVFVAALMCGMGAQAQTVEELERAGFVRDSVADVLEQYRNDYAQNRDKRKALAPKILELERQFATLQAQYEAVVAKLSKRDAQAELKAYEAAVKAADEHRKRKVVVVEKRDTVATESVPIKPNLVANGYFLKNLMHGDYLLLQESQEQEQEVVKLVDEYLVEYAKLLALHTRYMEVPTKAQADSVALLFKTKQAEMLKLNAAIAATWSPIFSNKSYLYQKLMEQDGNHSILNMSAEVLARAKREVEESNGKYSSDALMEYVVRKRALTKYEIEIASHLQLTISRDSLNVVAAELEGVNYRLAELSLSRRNFIRYEDVEIESSSRYSSSNSIPQTEVEDYGTVYRVRIAKQKKKISISSLRGAAPISYIYDSDSGEYSYFAGGFRTEKEAQEALKMLKERGIKTPVVAVWVDGDYYPTLEDMLESPNQYNIEISGVAVLSDDVKRVLALHKSDYTISRSGSTFVVGAFVGISSAEAVEAALKAVDAEMEIKITKQQ